MPQTNLAPEYTTQYWEPCATGPVFQADLTNWAGMGVLPGTIAAAGNFTSNVITSDGFRAIAAAVTSTQTGAISIQRYVDRAGTIPQGAALSTSLVASTSAVVNANDGVAFQSFTIKITNTGGSTATITGFALLLNAA
jgi:hypothetical protein